MAKKRSQSLHFPAGKTFAFSILDDTDDATLENVRPVYDLLSDLGFRTTKTVWPVACPEGSEIFFAAETLADEAYRRYITILAERGFEITWHGATMESSTRERTSLALEAFREHLGVYPPIHCNHGHNAENIYWGLNRYRSPPLRFPFHLKVAIFPERFSGENPSSPFFWGDLCKAHFRYVRNFTFKEINSLRCDPETPYSLSGTPFVNLWFSTSDAPDLAAFNQLVTPASLDRLEREGGFCILSTHLGKRFCRNGRIDSTFKETMTYLARKNGWFVPVSTLLDHLVDQGRGRPRSGSSLMRLELRHIADRLRKP